MDELLAGRRILVVEDETLIAMMLEDMLADLGCDSMEVAATAAHALELASTQTFDAALLDINLYGLPSYPVARALDARGVPFAFSTGSSILDVDELYSDRKFLRKPFRLSDLRGVLERLLPSRAPAV